VEHGLRPACLALAHRRHRRRPVSVPARADSLAHRLAGILQLISALPDLLTNLARYLQPFGIKLDRASLEKQLTTDSDDLISAAQHVTGGILRIAASLAGVVFEVSVVAFFTFYMVAQGPQLRRVVLTRLRPRRQRQILEVWEEAIRQTGGYFYSRLLIALINGSLMFLVLWIRHVPFAAPLAVFEAALATFIPVVGTYIGGAAPVAGALLVSPVDAIIALDHHLPADRELPAGAQADGQNHGRVRAHRLRRRADRRCARRVPVRVPGPPGGRHHPVGDPEPRPPVRGH
jgi:AI-2E family transporter